MGIRFRSTLILIFCILTMVSIGFSAWVVTTPNVSTTVDGKLDAESIVDNKNFISAPVTSIFQYNELGFLDQNDRLSKKGEVNVKYTINVDNCKDFFNSSVAYTDLQAEITLKYNDEISSSTNIFNAHNDANGQRTLNISYSTNGTNYTALNSSFISIKDNNQCVSSIILSNAIAPSSSGSLNLFVKYEFDIDSGKYFYNNVYPVLSIEGFTFEVSARLQAVATTLEVVG